MAKASLKPAGAVSRVKDRGAQPVVRERTGQPYRTSDAQGQGRVTVTATEAKTRFGPLLEAAIQGRSVVITRHDTPKAVLLSIAEFESLVSAGQPNLDTLSDQFDGLLARMQTASARGGLQSAFEAPPATLGRLAVSRAKRRG